MSNRNAVLALVGLMVGCGMGEASKSSAGIDYGADVAQSPPAVADQVVSLVASERKPDESSGPRFGVVSDSLIPSMIIRTGQAYIEVDSLEAAMADVQRLAQSVGGYIANSSVQGGQGQQRTATLEIKVPAARYEQVMSGLQGIGKLVSSNTTAQDVGEEFVDVTARMANARRLEERLVTLLATRTGKLDDVLAVERELARVREEIERYEGRLRYLRSQAAVSTLTVTVAEPAPVVGQPGSNVIAEAFKQAWRNLVGVVANGIELTGGLLPVIVLAVVALLGFRRWRRVKLASRATQES